MLKKFAVCFLLAAALVLAQSPVNVITAVVPQANNVQVSIVGTPGTTTYCYWVVAVYAGGKASPAGPACISNAPNTLSSTNYDVVSFSAPTNTIVAPTGYDLLRTTSRTVPTGTANQSVATAQSASPINDQSNSLSSYSVATISGNAASVLDIISATIPTLRTFVNGEQVFSTGDAVQVATGSATVAQVATGVVIVPGQTGHVMKVVGGAIIPVGGTVATCTDIRIENSDFAADTFRFLVSGTLTAIMYDEASPAAQVTIGAGTAFGTAYASGKGIGIQSTGSTCTTTTSFLYRVFYTVN